MQLLFYNTDTVSIPPSIPPLRPIVTWTTAENSFLYSPLGSITSRGSPEAAGDRSGGHRASFSTFPSAVATPTLDSKDFAAGRGDASSSRAI